MPGITTNNDIELMKRCTNLRTVNVQWVNSELCEHGVPKSVERLRKEYRLDGMLSLFNLETLILAGPCELMPGHSSLQQLKEWFHAEFEKEGKKTKVLLQ